MNRRILAATVAAVLVSSWSGAARADSPWPPLLEPAPAVVGGIENYLLMPGVPGAERNAKDWYAYLSETLWFVFIGHGAPSLDGNELLKVLSKSHAKRIAVVLDACFSGLNFVLQKREGAYKPLLEAAPGTPKALAEAIEKCLKPDPQDRFQTAAEFAKAMG